MLTFYQVLEISPILCNFLGTITQELHRKNAGYVRLRIQFQNASLWSWRRYNPSCSLPLPQVWNWRCVLPCVKIFSAMPLLDKGTLWRLMVERGSGILCIGEAFSCSPRVGAKRLYRLGNISDAIAKSSVPEL
jgi:hypothetical protein